MNILNSIQAKIIAIVASAGLVGGGVIFAKNWWDSQIESAKESGRQEIYSQTQKFAQEKIDDALRKNNIRIEELQTERQVLRGQVQDLQKMLLVDHDLDKLLQSKPDMILKRVNEGTDEVLKELEEATR